MRGQLKGEGVLLSTITAITTLVTRKNTSKQTLQPDVVLQIGLHFSQLRLVVVAPGQALGYVLLRQRLLHLLGHQEETDVGQIFDVGLLRESHGRVVEAGAQEVFDQHPVDSGLLPLILGDRTRRNAAALKAGNRK